MTTWDRQTGVRAWLANRLERLALWLRGIDHRRAVGFVLPPGACDVIADDEPAPDSAAGPCTCGRCEADRARQPGCCCSCCRPADPAVEFVPAENPILSIKLDPVQVEQVKAAVEAAVEAGGFAGRVITVDRAGFDLLPAGPPRLAFRTPDGDRAVVLVYRTGGWEVKGERYVADRTGDALYLTHIPLDEIVVAHANRAATAGAGRGLAPEPAADDTGEFPAVCGGLPAPDTGNPVG